MCIRDSVHAGDPKLNVVGGGHGSRAVARGQLGKAVVQPQALDEAAGLVDELLEHPVAVLGAGVAEHLHLVELVAADHAALAGAVGAGLAAVAGRVGEELFGQLVLGAVSYTHLTGLQLFGREPEYIGLAAQELEGEGFAFIDLNFGCPAPKIVGNGEGSALMREPKLLGEIVRAAVRATKLPVTEKIRAGWDAQSANAAEVARVCEGEGARAVACLLYTSRCV